MTVTAPQESSGPARRAGRLARGLLALAASLLLSVAAAHATIVFGTVTSEPSPPTPEAVTTLRLEMVDPVDAPVEDAVVFVEATPPSGGEPRVSDRFAEPDPGIYRTELILDEPGAWTLLFRDQTFRQEEARATLQVRVGAGGTEEALSFIFPPTATGPQGIGTWLLWLIGLPVAAGAIVTIMVLRGGQPSPAAEQEPSDA